MQQNQEHISQISLLLSRAKIDGVKPLSAENYLASLCDMISKESEVSKVAQECLATFKTIDSLYKDMENNSHELKKLREQFLVHINKIKEFVIGEQSEKSLEMKRTFQLLQNALQDKPFSEKNRTNILSNKQPNIQFESTGTEYLHSMGFDQIVSMINAASVHVPEWMSRTGTLLILDSNLNTSQALMRRLTREGHKVLNAENETQAIDQLHSSIIDAILIDYMMFKENLYDFLRKIEKDPSVEYMPVIIIGPPENTEDIKRITESGVADYLAKPVNPALLKVCVHAVLEKKYAFEQRVKRSQEMHKTRRELEAAIQNLPDGFAIFDQDSHMVMHNDKLFEFYPHLKNREEMTRGGLTFERFIDANVSAGIYIFEGTGKEAIRTLAEEKKANFLLPASQWEESLLNGMTLGITTYRTPDGGGALVVKDISQDKAQHQDLTFLAYHDSLTGLPNRKSFYQKLNQSIQSIQESGNGLLAILFLDLDGFKIINDSYGHEMGDWLLNQVGQRLWRCIRGDDMLARFGGDEFCILLTHVQNRNKVEMVARRILKSLSEPYIRNDITMTIGVSIGIGVY